MKRAVNFFIILFFKTVVAKSLQIKAGFLREVLEPEGLGSTGTCLKVELSFGKKSKSRSL